MDANDIDFQALDEEVNKATQQVFHTMQRIEDEQGPEHSSVFISSLLAAILTNLTVATLESCPEEIVDGEEQYEFTHENFKALKAEIEKIVGFSLRKGMHIFSGEYIDYYCEISHMPEAYNKTPC